ncbi:MAG: hypothetical protein R2698_02190 [Microthrixaceae bacterium]
MSNRSVLLRWIPLSVGVAIGVAFALTGHWVKASAIAVAMVLLLVARLFGIELAPMIGRAAARAVSSVAFGVLGLGLAVSGLIGRLLRRGPFRSDGTRAVGWSQAVASTGPEARPFAVETIGVPTIGSVRRFSRLFGAVGILAVINLLVGFGIAHLCTTIPSEVADVINITGAPPNAPRDPRQDLPAMADAPWRAELFHEMQVTPGQYWPFTTFKPHPYRSRYLNILGWDRRTYEPARLDRARTPIVWMFGGSTTWGEAQRDDYTIASELSKVAERAGTPMVIRNFGQRGWSHFQELILFEQLTAHGQRPDIAVFYDGANEIRAQQSLAKGVPSTVQADQIALAIDGKVTGVPDVKPPNAAVAAWRRYSRYSALHMVARWLRRVFVPDAGAAPATRSQQVVYPQPTDEDVDRAADVYKRGRSMTAALAKARGIRAMFYLQPKHLSPPDRRLVSEIGPPSIDISDTLEDHDDVFIDGTHHNEKGARIVAQRLWDTLGPAVARVSNRLHRAPDPSRNRRSDDSGPSVTTAPTSTTTTSTTTTTVATTTVAPPVSSTIGPAALASLVTRLGSDPCVASPVRDVAGVTRASNDADAAILGSTMQRLVGLLAQVDAASGDAGGARRLREAAEQLGPWLEGIYRARGSVDPGDIALQDREFVDAVDRAFRELDRRCTDRR